MKIARFKQYKKRIFAKQEKKTILFKNLNVIPYPMHDNTFKIMFEEFYKSNSFTFHGKKTLIVKLENNAMKIITER
jgi:murein L,D-transpeptidase YafK